jgi:hypothetical protein
MPSEEIPDSFESVCMCFWGREKARRKKRKWCELLSKLKQKKEKNQEETHDRHVRCPIISHYIVHSNSRGPSCHLTCPTSFLFLSPFFFLFFLVNLAFSIFSVYVAVVQLSVSTKTHSKGGGGACRVYLCHWENPNLILYSSKVPPLSLS